MKFGYARVSTEEQHLDLQLTALRKYGCDQIFSDLGVSGGCFDRPGLSQALSEAQAEDTLVVWRLDRLGRSLGQLVSLISDLGKRRVDFVSLNEKIDTQSSSGMLMFHMIAALAEFERSLISERTRAGMAAAFQRGSRPGRPAALTTDKCIEAKHLLQRYSYKEVAQMLKVHEKTLRRHLGGLFMEKLQT
jgi:DNA invertase Pin-like site-specific DNA recombinase